MKNKKQYCGPVVDLFLKAQRDDLDYRVEARKALNFCLKGLKVLDIGCGTGNDIRYFSSQGAVTYGIDISEQMIAATHKNTSDAKIILGDYSELPFENDFFEVVFSQFSFEHAKNLEMVFSEVYRVLKTHGCFLFVVEHPIKQFFDKPSRNYFKKEEYTDTFFDGSVSVKVFSHIFTEYLSPFVLSHFRVISFLEKVNPTDKVRSNYTYPGYMIIKLVKDDSDIFEKDKVYTVG